MRVLEALNGEMCSSCKGRFYIVDPDLGVAGFAIYGHSQYAQYRDCEHIDKAIKVPLQVRDYEEFVS